VPDDYARMMKIFKEVESSGLGGEEAVMAAFEMNMKDVSRVSGN
jgi:glutamate synthase (ferredoxin)